MIISAFLAVHGAHLGRMSISQLAADLADFLCVLCLRTTVVCRNTFPSAEYAHVHVPLEQGGDCFHLHLSGVLAGRSALPYFRCVRHGETRRRIGAGPGTAALAVTAGAIRGIPGPGAMGATTTAYAMTCVTVKRLLKPPLFVSIIGQANDIRLDFHLAP